MSVISGNSGYNTAQLSLQNTPISKPQAPAKATPIAKSVPAPAPSTVVTLGQVTSQTGAIYTKIGITEQATAKQTAAAAAKQAAAANKLAAANAKQTAAVAKQVAATAAKEAAAAAKLATANVKQMAAAAKQIASASKQVAVPAKTATANAVAAPAPNTAGAKVTTPAAVAASDTGFIAGSGDVVVDIKNSDSGYQNAIYWSADNFKTRHYIGIDNNTGTYNLGTFKTGTKIEFGIDNGMNQFYRTGAASNNADGIEHAQTSKTADGVQIGFEDLFGGGDRDFNDAIITVKNVAAPTSTPVAGTLLAGNRSGLGDGTNPGQGTGSTNSPNLGTNNPNNATPVAVAPSAAPLAPAADAGAVNATSNNRSGLGDGTNPGQGAGRSNSPNLGTNNPNAAATTSFSVYA